MSTIREHAEWIRIGYGDPIANAQAILDALDAGSEETRGLPPSMCIQGRFPLPYKVLVLDLEPRVYRDYYGGHDITDPVGVVDDGATK